MAHGYRLKCRYEHFVYLCALVFMAGFILCCTRWVIISISTVNAMFGVISYGFFLALNLMLLGVISIFNLAFPKAGTWLKPVLKKSVVILAVLLTVAGLIYLCLGKEGEKALFVLLIFGLPRIIIVCAIALSQYVIYQNRNLPLRQDFFIAGLFRNMSPTVTKTVGIIINTGLWLLAAVLVCAALSVIFYCTDIRLLSAGYAFCNSPKELPWMNPGYIIALVFVFIAAGAILRRLWGENISNMISLHVVWSLLESYRFSCPFIMIGIYSVLRGYYVPETLNVGLGFAAVSVPGNVFLLWFLRNEFLAHRKPKACARQETGG